MNSKQAFDLKAKQYDLEYRQSMGINKELCEVIWNDAIEWYKKNQCTKCAKEDRT